MRYFTFSPSRHLLLNPLNHHSLHRLWWGIGSFHYHLLVIVAYQHLSSVLVLGRHHFLVIRDIVCFHFSFWLHRHIFVARISFSCRHGVFRSSFHFRCWILDFHCLLQKEHCPHSLAYATYLCAVPLWCSSAIRLSPGSCHIFHCKVKASRLPKISYGTICFTKRLATFRTLYLKWVFLSFSLKLFACALSLLTFG